MTVEEIRKVSNYDYSIGCATQSESESIASIGRIHATVHASIAAQPGRPTRIFKRDKNKIAKSADEFLGEADFYHNFPIDFSRKHANNFGKEFDLSR